MEPPDALLKRQFDSVDDLPQAYELVLEKMRR
jgi:hypothetical protein